MPGRVGLEHPWVHFNNHSQRQAGSYLCAPYAACSLWCGKWEVEGCRVASIQSLNKEHKGMFFQAQCAGSEEKGVLFTVKSGEKAGHDCAYL